VSTLSRHEARQFFAEARVARLATVDGDGHPHLVPIVFVLERETIYSAVDAKPKRSTDLRRLANVAANPAVSVLVDHYDDVDWAVLRWSRADGVGRVLAPDHEQARLAVGLLAQKYRQHREHPPDGAVLAIDVRRWSGWSGSS
jgi:PPOX class probable F420-dependent enzyme